MSHADRNKANINYVLETIKDVVEIINHRVKKNSYLNKSTVHSYTAIRSIMGGVCLGLLLELTAFLKDEIPTDRPLKDFIKELENDFYSPKIQHILNRYRERQKDNVP